MGMSKHTWASGLPPPIPGDPTPAAGHSFLSLSESSPPRTVMTKFYLRLIGICLLIDWCTAASTHGGRQVNTGTFHKHSESDLDVVQCHHAVYRVPQNGGKPELVNGQESRVNAKQYLPPPGSPSPPKEEDPAASFNQPNFLSVENAFISPNLQKNYNSLFGQKKPDETPAAAQNVFSNAVPEAPRKVTGIKHSHNDDDENNLERLCNDAFHSFLCKPIKGPRKTPTGRLRENAVLPPGVLGQASFQDVSRVKPDDSRSTSTSNNVGFTVTKPTNKNVPIQPSPPNGYLPQRIPFPQPIPTTQRATTTTTAIPFANIYKPEKSVLPSPSYNNPQIILPQPPHDCEKSKSTSPPFLPYPTFIKPYTTPTPKPQKNEYYIPIIPFPSNNSPKIALPPANPTTQPPHDCDKSKSTIPHFSPSPSNQNPAFLKPYLPPSPKPLKQENSIPIIPFPSNNFPNVALPPKPQPPLQFPPSTTPPPHNCDQHRQFPHSFENPKTQSPAVFRTQPTFKPLDKFKVPEASNNIAQIIAQPQQVNTVSVSPQKPTGYFYDKPAVPFPPPPTTQRPYPPSTPKPTSGYVYDTPRIPFATNNFAQVVLKPVDRKTATNPPPCEHGQHHSAELTNPSNDNAVVLNPGNRGDSYSYIRPSVPFPSEPSDPTNQNPVNLKPFVTTTRKPTTGYSYQPPKNPLLLPNPTNQFKRIVSPTNTGYNYQKPDNPFPPQSNFPSNNNQIFVTQSKPTNTQPPFKPYPTTSKPFNGYSYDQPSVPFPNINSKLSLPSDTKPQYVAKPQTREEVTVRPGYSYNKPSIPFSQSTAGSGYSYPKPSSPFPR